MLHRAAGDVSTLEAFETRFDVAHEWVAAEKQASESFTRWASMPYIGACRPAADA